jgi:cytoskeleton protein RodZ
MSDTPQLNDGQVEQGAQTPETPQTPVGPGAQLAAYRQARGFTIEQVANQLNLAPRQIQALEEDNYAALPGLVIARGFIRAYAKLLKVDPAPLVSLMQAEAAPMDSMHIKQALSGSFSESHLPPNTRKSLQSKSAIGAVSAVVIALGLFAVYWFGLIPGAARIDTGANASGTGGSVQSTQSQTATVPSTDHVELPKISGINGAAVTPQSNEQQLSPSTTPTAGTPTPATAAPSAPPVVMASPSPTRKPELHDTAPAAQDVANLHGKNMLVMKVHEDSWIEIRAADNTVLISRLEKAGSTEALSVTRPISVTVGNVAGVDMTLRGNPVDLKSAAKNNVAHLNLK